ncbi:MAG TPA: hypothetical protein VHP81_07425 [Lachnospiraceae bacterium]|nr:hypothetical protein [Lachnospiraceae bacterium]
MEKENKYLPEDDTIVDTSKYEGLPIEELEKLVKESEREAYGE